MEHVLTRVWEQLLARVSGPMKFRLVLQPSMAIFLAIRGGLRDAREGKPPYFWGLCTDPQERTTMLKEGWKSIGKVFIVAVVLDVVYQIIVQKFVYPGETIIVAIILAIVPYLLVRGPINRIVCRSRKAVAKGPLSGD
jgi:hypothetical protein